MKKIFFTSIAAILFLTSAFAQNPWTGDELRLQGKSQTRVKRIQKPMTGVIFYRLSDSTVCVRNPNNTVVALGPGGGYEAVDTIWRTPGIDSIFFTINGTQYQILDSVDFSPFDTLGGNIIEEDTTLNVLLTKNLTADSTFAVYKIRNGSSNTQVLFNNAGVIKGDAGMVYNATNNKLTVDSLVFTGASIGNGTAANPTIYFTNSTGVGFYRSASNVLGIATAGSERVTIDAQGDINVAGGRGVNSVADADMWATFMPTDAQQALTDTGAANVTSYFTALTTTVASPVTLAAGTQIGQLKKITLVVDGGFDATLTLTGYTSIVFNDAGDYVLLLWNGSAWFATENSGCTITP